MTSVAFFDLFGTLIERTEEGLRVLPSARALLHAAGPRVGLLGSFGAGTRADLTAELVRLGLTGLFEDELVLDPALWGLALPDPRVFSTAAVMARTPISDCVFISADPAFAIASTMAGARSVSLPAPSPTAVTAVTAPIVKKAPSASLLSAAPAAVEPEPAPVLFAAVTPADAWPTYVLEGRVVTLNARSQVIDRGRVLVRAGQIVAVEPSGGELPEEFRRAPRLDTGGTIYPGLIDLHNHFVYNVLPLWTVPKKYANRTQWPRHADYQPQISLPVRLLASYSESARALVRYVEAKALIGGTTTGQGIRTQVRGGPKLFRGAMRNVEDPGDKRLPKASTRVPDLYPKPDRVDEFRRALEKFTSYFYHLGEGVDDYARERFFDLLDNNLVTPSLVGIHSLGLQPSDLSKMAELGGKVVWSPFSNLLLYGKTLDVEALLSSGAAFSIGCDWSPSGSKNLLQELKVARFEAARQGASLSAEALVRAVTSDAAKIIGWERHAGALKPGALADLLVLSGTEGDPYEALIDATEPEVALVAVGGVARYGDKALMRKLQGASRHRLEDVSIGGAGKALSLWSEGSELNELTFEKGRAILHDAMADLPGFREQMDQEQARLHAFGVEIPQPFVVELDNEPGDVLGEAFNDSHLLADFTKVADSVELDSAEVGGESYWKRIERQANLPDELFRALRSHYE